MGVTGNHAINGKIFFEKGLLLFTDIVAMQNGNTVENDFVKNLQYATGYMIENNRLLLFNSAGQLLQFKKTD
jgi:heat shock protein HslJ